MKIQVHDIKNKITPIKFLKAFFEKQEYGQTSLLLKITPQGHIIKSAFWMKKLKAKTSRGRDRDRVLPAEARITYRKMSYLV